MGENSKSEAASSWPKGRPRYQDEDIVTKIKAMYMKKGQIAAEDRVQPLAPTKVALFGLESRLREVEGKISAKKVHK